MTKKNTQKPHVDVHDRITSKIIKCIEDGAGELTMPWHSAGVSLENPENVDTKNHYRGINVLSLWVDAMVKGFGSSTWGTYRQWQKQGCQVRKGETASVVVVYKNVQAKGASSKDKDAKKGMYFLAKAASVFNAEQVDGYEAPAPEQEPVSRVERLMQVETFVAATGADVRHGGASAHYNSATDSVHMPEVERFIGSGTSTATEAYYGVLLHELTHWTKTKTRCDRPSPLEFEKEAYATEELVAELGAAFLCADLGVTQEPRADHAQYVEHWLKVFKGDNRAIFKAAAQASKAAEFLRGLQHA